MLWIHVVNLVKPVELSRGAPSRQTERRGRRRKRVREIRPRSGHSFALSYLEKRTSAQRTNPVLTHGFC